MLNHSDLLDQSKKDYLTVFNSKINRDSVCWWCTFPFDSLPVCAPLTYNSIKDVFGVCGYFCCFSCAKAYIIDKKSPYIDPSLITLLNKRLTGKLTTVRVAPPRETLLKFGGNLTIEEFRNNISPQLKDIVTNQQLDYKTERDLQPYTQINNNKKYEEPVNQSYAIEQHSQSTTAISRLQTPKQIPETPIMINEEALTKRKYQVHKDQADACITSPPHNQRSKNTLDNFMNIKFTKK